MSSSWKTGLVGVAMALCASSVSAWVITCLPNGQRPVTLIDAIDCTIQDPINLNGAHDINALFGIYDWMKGGKSNSQSSKNLFSLIPDSLDTRVTGTSHTGASFPQAYNRSAIAMPFGPGGGNSNTSAWLITPGETSGAFTDKDVAAVDRGLTNDVLFGSNSPEVKLPEPNIALLLMTGLVSIFLIRRRIAS